MSKLEKIQPNASLKPAARHHPGLSGFTRANLFRMRQFYETYRGDEKVAPVVRQIPWSHNPLILSRCKRPEEREFYLRLACSEGWSRRDLERQLAGSFLERAVLPPKVSPLLRQLRPAPRRSSATPTSRVPGSARRSSRSRPAREPAAQPSHTKLAVLRVHGLSVEIE